MGFLVHHIKLVTTFIFLSAKLQKYKVIVYLSTQTERTSEEAK